MTTQSSEPVPPPNAPIVLLDTHIHLYPSSHLPNLAWCHPKHPLWSPHTLKEYAKATMRPAALAALSDQFPTIPLPPISTTDLDSTTPEKPSRPTPSSPKPRLQLDGCVFIETDRETDPTNEAIWQTGPLNEIRFVASLMPSATSTSTNPSKNPSDPLPTLKAFISWAPLASHPAPAILDRYLSFAQTAAESPSSASTSTPSELSIDPPSKPHPRPSGFRFLVQDKPQGTMTSAPFHANLVHLFLHSQPESLTPPIFELGIDVHRSGTWQIDEAEKMLQLLDLAGSDDRGGGRRIKAGRIVLNHMAKPPMRSRCHPSNIDAETVVVDKGDNVLVKSEWTEIEVKLKHHIRVWMDGIKKLARFKNVVCKISGGFSELGPGHVVPIFPTQRVEDRAATENASTYEEKCRIYREALQKAAEHMGYFMDVVVEAFGWDRVGWGSDWPVCAVTEEGERDSRWGEWLWCVRWWIERRKREGRGPDEKEEKGFWAGVGKGWYGVED